MKNQFKTMVMATLLLVAANKLQAQTIPNSGFETWTSMGTYNEPDGWATLNIMTKTASVYTAEKGTPGNVGSSYLKLTSKAVSGLGVVNGIATSGILDAVTMKPKSGFAYNIRPAKLTGKWQHMIFGNSQGYAEVKLTRWDATSKARIPVASGIVTLSGMAMSWASFSITLNYVDNANPDSCMITFSASGNEPTENDYIWIDALAFTGTVSGINDVKKSELNIVVSPNPSNSNWNVTTKNTSDKITVKLFNILGEEIIIENSTYIENNTQLNISNVNLPIGLYYLSITNGTTFKKIQLIKN